MPIPPLNEDGFLPVGVYECTIFEVRTRFGQFQGTDQRPRLFARLDFERDLPMSDYALVSRLLLRRRYGFDILIARHESRLYDEYLEFFSRVRDNPGIRKGLLRLNR